MNNEINGKFEINERAISTPASAVTAIKVPKISFGSIALAVTKKPANPPKANKTDVLNGHRVPTMLYENVMHHMEKRMPNIKADTLYTLKSMCGRVFWNAMNSWQRRASGRAFAHMVHTGMFPFKFVQYKRSPTKRYLLK